MFKSTEVSGTVISTYCTYNRTSTHTDLHSNSFSLVIDVSQWNKMWRLQVFLDVLGKCKMEAVLMATGAARGPGSCYHLSE